MPAAPRTNKKGKEIAFKVLGVPDNLRQNKKSRKKIEERLVFDETSRVR